MANQNQGQGHGSGRTGTQNRGFASMSEADQREIARMGGAAVSEDREHMAAIGRRGGEASAEARAALRGASRGESPSSGGRASGQARTRNDDGTFSDADRSSAPGNDRGERASRPSSASSGQGRDNDVRSSRSRDDGGDGTLRAGSDSTSRRGERDDT